MKIIHKEHFLNLMSVRRVAFFAVILLLLVACSGTPLPPTAAPGEEGDGEALATVAGAESDAESAASPTPQALAPPVAATATLIPPTSTPTEPLAATVNDQPITLAEFEQALARHEQGQALILAPEPAEGEGARHVVLEMLIEQALIEQAAAAAGVTITEEMIENQIVELRQEAEEAGGEGAFEAWLASNQWTEAQFREALAFEMLTERLAALVTADVPDATEQVRARYIQVDDPQLANSLREQIVEGADFAELARQHSLDRATGEVGGDLGYFPEGSLLVPEIEQAAFTLEPGEVSEVIAGTLADGSQTTYYLVQTVEVDPARPLSPNLRAALLQERFEAWLAEEWSSAEIIRFLETGA